MTSKADLRDSYRSRYGSGYQIEPLKAVEPPLPTGVPIGGEPERAFVLHAESGRTVITAPIREIAKRNGSFTYLTGRLVGADQPNGNGALWSTEDLQLGEASVAGGPLNWLHDENKIIGCLLDGSLIQGREEAAGLGNHIVSNAAVWSFLYPRETAVIEKAAADGQLYYSMECISREVGCVDSPGRPGCGDVVSYGDYDAGKCCQHLRERSSIRRFIDPLFQGAAVIVPPVRPGWGNATVEVARQAAALAESQIHDASLSESQARDLATAVLGWANR